MTAEQPSVEALREYIHHWARLQSQSGQDKAEAALDSLTAALRDTNENFLNARDHAEAAEARAQKAEAALEIIAAQTYPATYSHTDENGTQHYGKYEDAAQFARSVLDEPPTE